MFNPERAGPHDNESLRDFQAEFEAFLVEHGIVISVKEVYHLNPFGEATDEIRQHNHTIVRSNRTKRSLSVCTTTMNWENSPVLASALFANLAADARILEESERNLLQWAPMLDLDPDSRSVERKFNQTANIAEALRGLLGEHVYVQLLQLSLEYSESLGESDDDDNEDDDE
ncbi:MAG: hypothetical protein ABI625_15490 [bacterium]